MAQWLVLSLLAFGLDAGDSAAGASREHWAFQPLRRPTIPAVQHESWPRSPVDRFILAKLEEHGLAPTHRADAHTLIRRATYDLTGLPPSASEIDRFLNDNSSNAFASVVDRLLDSPPFGERWGRHWLDIARYADTKGYIFTAKAQESSGGTSIASCID